MKYKNFLAGGAALFVAFFFWNASGVVNSNAGISRSKDKAGTLTLDLRAAAAEVQKHTHDSAILAAELVQAYRLNGLEPGTAGFHAKRQAYRFSNFSQSVDQSGRPYETIPSYSQSELTDPFADPGTVEPPLESVTVPTNVPSARWLTLDRFPSNSIFSTIQAVPDTAVPGKFCVETILGADDVQALKGLLVTDVGAIDSSLRAATPVVDWAGVYLNTGDSVTELWVAPVSDNVHYECFSISAIVKDSVVGVPIILAKALSQAEASQLVQRLQQ